jgi:putative sugar O-methyltransferase
MAAIADPFLLSCVSENPAGSIECVEYRGQLLSQNLVRHAAFVGRIAQHVNLTSRLTILEIGGGYGGLARLFRQESPRSTVILVDIPSSLALATYFLTESCPGARVATITELPPSGPLDSGLTEYDFVLLPGAWLARLPAECIDLVVNTTSFQEMPRQTIARYFAEIHRLCRGHFYCYNRLFTPSQYGGVSFADYPFDDRWRTLSQALSPEGHFEWIGRRM